jgi:integrase
MRGSKRQRSPGVWELRVYVGQDPATGTEKTLSKTFRGPARAADAALRELLEAQAPNRADGIGVTFGQLLDRWLVECERMELSPTTMRSYRSQVERVLRPRLGGIHASRLSAKHLDDLYGAMRADGKSPKTIRNLHATVSSALHQAERWGWVRQNVAELAKPPRVAQRRLRPPSIDAVRSIIEAAEVRDPRLAPLLMLAALTGMRRGELCALRWSDVRLDTGLLEVSRSVVVIPGGVTEKSTKTDRERLVALDDVGVAVLQQHRVRVDDFAAAVEFRVEPTSFVFSPEPDGSVPYRPDTVTSFFIRVRNGLGMKGVRLHDLRHFTATQLIGAGVDVRTVAGRLGHSDPSLTLRTYAHVLEDRDRAAASVMGRVLTAQRGDGTTDDHSPRSRCRSPEGRKRDA